MKALIYGITGQDGSYLAELLLNKGYEVFGVSRWSSTSNLSRIQHIRSRITVFPSDITDTASTQSVISRLRPDEIYNLAAISSTHYPASQSILQVTGVGPINIFEAVRNADIQTKIFQASSSEMLDMGSAPQDERTRYAPTNTYGAAKLLAHNMAQVYREKYGLFISCGVLFNHESPRRTEDFVSRKITAAAARIRKGKQKTLELWDLASMRDWGYAKEYVEAMWMMLQRERSGEFVIGSGKSHSVEDFVRVAFQAVGLDWREYVTNPTYMCKIGAPQANIQKANIVLGWRPKTTFEELVQMMVAADFQQTEN